MEQFINEIENIRGFKMSPFERGNIEKQIFFFKFFHITNLVILGIFFVSWNNENFIFNDIYLSSLSKYNFSLISITIASMIFVLNIYSNKVLNKPFSYYYSKYTTCIYNFFIPFTIFLLLGIFNINSYIFIYISLFNIFFYTYLIISIINDVFKWNKYGMLLKYKEIYQEALVELPLSDECEKYILELEEIKNAYVHINYDDIYRLRLKKIFKLQEFGKVGEKEIKIDPFTLHLIKLSVIDLKKKEIVISEKNKFFLHKDFFSKIDNKFLKHILYIKNFRMDNFDKNESFEIILNNYIKNIEKFSDFQILKSKLKSSRSIDLEEVNIISSLYLSMYLNGSTFKLILDNLTRIDSLDELIIIEAIILQHNEMLNQNPLRIINGLKDKMNEINLTEMKFLRLESPYENITELNEVLLPYKNLFGKILYKVEYHNFRFADVYTNTLQSSNILVYFIAKHKNSLFTKLSNNPNFDSNNITSEEQKNLFYTLNDYFWTANQNFHLLTSHKEKKAIQKEVEKIFFGYKEKLIEFNNVDFLMKNYTTIGGILTSRIINKLKETLVENGEYAIPILSDINDSMDLSSSKKKLTNFSEKFKDQFDNSESVFIFKEDNNIVKSKYIYKENIFIIFIKVLINDDNDYRIFSNKFKDNIYFQKALSIHYVDNPMRFEKFIDRENINFIKGVQKRLKTLFMIAQKNNSPIDDIIKKRDQVKFLFENKKIIEELEVEPHYCVRFLEDLHMPYTVKNFDLMTLENPFKFSIFSFLNDMKYDHDINFLKTFISSKYYTKENDLLDCYFLNAVNKYLLYKFGYSNEEVRDILMLMIDKISSEKVIEGKYKAKKINEYNEIKTLLDSFKNDSELELFFIEKIINNINEYFVNDVILK